VFDVILSSAEWGWIEHNNFLKYTSLRHKHIFYIIFHWLICDPRFNISYKFQIFVVKRAIYSFIFAPLVFVLPCSFSTILSPLKFIFPPYLSLCTPSPVDTLHIAFVCLPCNGTIGITVLVPYYPFPCWPLRDRFGVIDDAPLPERIGSLTLIICNILIKILDGELAWVQFGSLTGRPSGYFCI